MRTALSPLHLHRPRSLAEALAVRREDHGATPLAGGTDVYVALNAGTHAARSFLDLWGLRELRGIRRGPDGRVVIGAGTTFAEIAASPLVRRQAGVLADAARQIGGLQIQNRATLGGNIANASPAADAVPFLLAVEATFVLTGARGERRVRATEFFTAYRRTVMAGDELLCAVEIPRLRGRAWFRKVGTRAANAVSKVVMAAVRQDGRPSIAFGSVGPTVRRVPRTEAALAAGASVEQAAQELAAEISPVDDLRSTADYRRRVAAALLRQFWEETSR